MQYDLFRHCESQSEEIGVGFIVICGILRSTLALDVSPNPFHAQRTDSRCRHHSKQNVRIFVWCCYIINKHARIGYLALWIRLYANSRFPFQFDIPNWHSQPWRILHTWMILRLPSRWMIYILLWLSSQRMRAYSCVIEWFHSSFNHFLPGLWRRIDYTRFGCKFSPFDYAP